MNKDKELLKRFYFWGVIANVFIFIFSMASIIVIPYVAYIAKYIFYFYFSPVFFILTDAVFTEINKYNSTALIAAFLFYGSILITGYGLLSGLIGFKLYKNNKINKNSNTLEIINLLGIFKFLSIGILLSFILSFIIYFVNIVDYYLRLYIFLPIIISSLITYTAKDFFIFNINKIQENFGETKKRQVLHYSLIFAALNAATLFFPALLFVGRAVGLPSEVFIVSVLGLFVPLFFFEIKSLKGAGTLEEKKLFKLTIFFSAFCIIWNICLYLYYIYERSFNVNLIILLISIIILIIIIFSNKLNTKIKEIIYRNVIILFLIFLSFSVISNLLMSGIDRGKKFATLLQMAGRVEDWKKSGSPRGKDLEKYIENIGGFRRSGGKSYPLYVASNLVFNIGGTNVTTLFAIPPVPSDSYATFITEDCTLIELWPSGDVRVIKDMWRPPVGPPLSRFQPFYLPHPNE